MAHLKPKQELFCQRFVQNANASTAAVSAGYSPRSARTAGYRLLRRPEIVARIAEIQIDLARHACSDLEAMIGKLEVVYRRSVETHQFAAAARAVELQAKLAILVQRRALQLDAPPLPSEPGPPTDIEALERSPQTPRLPIYFPTRHDRGV